ncbi:uncharacterized protein BX664DRAFT_361624 [Halteromyces radiatus]|uniref:uncharacterized protein n=1 Tax=Halteromyces radiatus TaxID=101107 RepID=UPI002220B2E2|nr:uncharacterized protein BX664DRAFT_361624 [Halteromyces radiatus]KAI8081464.1 hypothetical protein BX664DRAFT_361624 [Halteromyces radiatus]
MSSFDIRNLAPELSFDSTNDTSLYAHITDSNDDSVTILTRVWMNERNAPELLPYQKHLIDNLIDSLEEQSGLVTDEMASSIENKFMSMLYQTEMERIRYLVKSYLRTRLFKIEKYTLELLRNPDYTEIMSSQEIVYARRYQELVESHNHESFLHHLPVAQHKQDEKTAELDMVVSANLEAPVFCKVLDDIGEIHWNVNDSTETTELEKGGTYIIRYQAIQQYLKEDRVQLI